MLTPIVPAGVPNDTDAPRSLREATQEFESLFIDQMMQAMRRTAPESGLMSAGSGGQLFQGMLDQEWSRQIAGSGGLGIGEILYRQLASAAGEAPGQGQDDEN